MKYRRPWNPNQKMSEKKFQSPHQGNPQPYPKPTKNPPAYRPNIQNFSSEPQEVPNSVKPKVICHKHGLLNHYAKDYLAEVPQIPKVKDFAYYACQV